MLQPWNDASLLPPPVNMFKCLRKIDLCALKHVFNNIIKVLSKQSPLHRESAVCSRFLYKYDKKFRHDIGYRNFKKVNTALKKYLVINLLKDIEQFLSALPSESDELYLPTRQMLEYVMLRIITFSKIMLRVCICSKQASIFYLDRIKRGESHWMSLLPYALLSRLWSMSMVLVQHSTTWYSNLYPYLNKLELKGLDFLPIGFKLPEDLEEWLDLKDVDNFGRFDWVQKKDVHVDSALIDDDENDLLDNILGYVNQINNDEVDPEKEEEMKPILNKIKEETNLQVKHVAKIDHGEALSRESFKLLLSNPKKDSGDSNVQSNTKREFNKQSKEVNEHCYKKITDCNSLRAFIDKEDTFRSESESRSLTKHLSLMQWHALKNSLLKLCDALTNRKIEKKFQKIWKEKCLDYMQ